MRFIAFLFLFIFASGTLWANGKAYLDLEDGQIVSVFNQPGMNWKNCAGDAKCKSVAWPDSSAQIEVVSPVKKMKVEDPYTGKLEMEEYVQVKYRYKRTVNGKVYTQEGQGWIDAAYVTNAKKSSFYGTAAAEKEECPPGAKTPAKDIQKSLEPLQKSLSNHSVTDTAKALSPYVGACVINPKNPPSPYAGGNPYDAYVLPALKKQGVPKIKREDGTLMTQQDLIEVDALARTLYAEMARCYKHGLHYPMTVAKISINRAEASQRKAEFIKGDHAAIKTPLAKVVTSPSQFSLWLKKIDGKDNPSLRHGLCPPSSKDKAFWTGAKPPPFEQDIWENTMRIATEAVLFPKKFNARTKQVKQFHYTSGMDGFYGMKQVFPWIEERKVSKNACVQVWDDKVKS
ncbi:hypothetical protein ACLWBD_12165 [Bdellovibrio sp. HCB117]|uniref:hypothetical protein n=1 Tax=Bdellovibrio sp. HCB117 TaxID=3394359 RepID=UPI0039B6A940